MSDAAQSNDGTPEDGASRDARAGLPQPLGETSEPAAPGSTAVARLRLIRLDAEAGPEAKASAERPAWTAAAPRRDWRRFRAAASLAAVVVIGAAAAAAHIHAQQTSNASEAQTSAVESRLDAMTARLESLEANRTRDELANMRKVLAEIKAGAAGARDLSGAIGQLATRVDKLEKDQGARLDKLGDRIDHDAAQRLADVTARLDKLEAKTVAQAAATPAKPSPVLKTTVAKTDAGVSNETTGAISKTPPRLRGFYLSEIHNGYAMIDSPAGEFSVGPGDLVPGGGRVLRIERRGHDWAVVTTQGEIVADDE